MPSIDESLRLGVKHHEKRRGFDARTAKEATELTDEERLELLRQLLSKEMIYLSGRIDVWVNSRTTKAQALRGRTHEMTYFDWEKKSKVKRTTRRLKLYLRLCDGDEALLMAEWDYALNRHIKTGFKSWVWLLELIRDENAGSITVKYAWKRALRVRLTVTP